MLLAEDDLIRKPVSTFRDHALGGAWSYPKTGIHFSGSCSMRLIRPAVRTKLRLNGAIDTQYSN
jgi:hypothetical protein